MGDESFKQVSEHARKASAVPKLEFRVYASALNLELEVYLSTKF